MRSLTASALARRLALAPLVLVPVLCGLLTGRPSRSAGLIGGVLVLGGVVAVSRHRHAGGSAILSMGLIGMLTGLLIDNRSYGPGGLAALCLVPRGGGAIDAMLFDLATMPAQYGMMVLAGIGTSVACGSRASGHTLAQTVTCNLAMLIGMLLSNLALRRLLETGIVGHIAWAPARPDLLLAAMPAGMVWGMDAGLMLLDRLPGLRRRLRIRGNAISSRPRVVRS